MTEFATKADVEALVTRVYALEADVAVLRDHPFGVDKFMVVGQAKDGLVTLSSATGQQSRVIEESKLAALTAPQASDPFAVIAERLQEMALGLRGVEARLARLSEEISRLGE